MFRLKTYDWLTSNFHKVSNIVVLVLLKGSKQHLENTVLVITSLFAFCLLFLFIFNLREATKQNKQLACHSMVHTQGLL
jgi:uncharacterized membrane protein